MLHETLIATADVSAIGTIQTKIMEIEKGLPWSLQIVRVSVSVSVNMSLSVSLRISVSESASVKISVSVSMSISVKVSGECER